MLFRSFASYGRMWLTAEGSQQRMDQVSHFDVVAYSGCLAQRKAVTIVEQKIRKKWVGRNDAERLQGNCAFTR